MKSEMPDFYRLNPTSGKYVLKNKVKTKDVLEYLKEKEMTEQRFKEQEGSRPVLPPVTPKKKGKKTKGEGAKAPEDRSPYIEKFEETEVLKTNEDTLKSIKSKYGSKGDLQDVILNVSKKIKTMKDGIKNFGADKSKTETLDTMTKDLEFLMRLANKAPAIEDEPSEEEQTSQLERDEANKLKIADLEYQLLQANKNAEAMSQKAQQTVSNEVSMSAPLVEPLVQVPVFIKKGVDQYSAEEEARKLKALIRSLANDSTSSGGENDKTEVSSFTSAVGPLFATPDPSVTSFTSAVGPLFATPPPPDPKKDPLGDPYDDSLGPESVDPQVEPVIRTKTVEIPSLKMQPKYHLDSILFNFGTITDVKWDQTLANNVEKFKSDKKTINLYIDTLISEYSKKFLIFKRKSDGDRVELNELLQLEQLFESNFMKRGDRAIVKVSDLQKLSARINGSNAKVQMPPRNDFVVDGVANSAEDQALMNQPTKNVPQAPSQEITTVTENKVIADFVKLYDNRTTNERGKKMVDDVKIQALLDRKAPFVTSYLPDPKFNFGFRLTNKKKKTY